MKVFRFFPNGTADISEGKLRNQVLSLSPKEAYGMQPEATGYIWRSRLFGFVKPKRVQILTVRVGDSSPLFPLEKGYKSPAPIDEYDLRDYENQFFLEKQLDVEKGKTKNKGFLEKVLIVGIACCIIAFIGLAVLKNLPSIKESIKGEGIGNIISQSPKE
jgi:hypothetical protein